MCFKDPYLYLNNSGAEVERGAHSFVAIKDSCKEVHAGQCENAPKTSLHSPLLGDLDDFRERESERDAGDATVFPAKDGK